jgi:hypothetical protein
MEAYERKEITQKSLASFRDLVQHRKCFGRAYGPGRNKGAGRQRTSVDSFVASYRAQAGRQKLLIKKARVCEARLLSITAAFRVLLADEDFVTLLRAEKIGTLPKFMAERIKEETRTMTEKVKSAFELRGITVPLDRLLPIRQIKPNDHCFGKYRSILASIREIGVVEPLVVHPQRGSKDLYLLLDGHMRLKALRELGKSEAPCLVATEDDAYTYNDKVSRIAPIQEHRMILRAVEQGVTPEDIARSLDVEVEKIRRGLNSARRNPSGCGRYAER